MTFSSIDSLAQAAAEHPILAVFLSALAAMFGVLVAIALARPRAFAFVLRDAAIENRLDRRLLPGAVIVAWSAGWPVTLAVIGARAVRRRR